MVDSEFDPATVLLEADLSRADVRVLYDFCRDKSVVEFGCGGSTLLLARFCNKVVSYDTSTAWINHTKKRLELEASHTCEEIHLCGKTAPDNLPTADVYFLDGHSQLRAEWLATVICRRLAKTILVHDSRSPIMSSIATVLVHPIALSIRTVEYHYDNSNMLVVRIDDPVKYEDWNLTEPENRLLKS